MRNVFKSASGRPGRLAVGVLVASVVATALFGAEISLPPDTSRLVGSTLPGYSLATAHCSTCHSVDYVRMQPASTRAYWKSSVVKMQKTFGAPIPDEVVEPIAEYLAKTYGTERPAAVSTKPGEVGIPGLGTPRSAASDK